MPKPKCPHCGEEMFLDETAGPIVGGYRKRIVKKNGSVGLSRGAHPAGVWMCMNCDGKGNTIKDILKELRDKNDKMP